MFGSIRGPDFKKLSNIPIVTYQIKGFSLLMKIKMKNTGVDIVPGGSNCCLHPIDGSNCCLNFALWFLIAKNPEIHKGSTVMDILYIFVWPSGRKIQNCLLYPGQTTQFFSFWVQLLPKFHLVSLIVACTFVRWKRNFIYPCQGIRGG